MRVKREGYFVPGHAPQAALVVAAGIGSVVGSLSESNTFFARCAFPRLSVFERIDECVPGENPVRLRAFHAIEKRREVDQLRARLHEIEVENLLASHAARLPVAIAVDKGKAH